MKRMVRAGVNAFPSDWRACHAGEGNTITECRPDPPLALGRIEIALRFEGQQRVDMINPERQRDSGFGHEPSGDIEAIT